MKSNVLPASFGRLASWLAMVLFCGAPLAGNAQVSIAAGGVALTEDFNTLAAMGTAATTLPAGWALAETGTNANAGYAAGDGSSSAGNTFSFGASTASERAFGGLRSGNLVPTVGAEFANATGQTVVQVAINYTGEQWRLGATGRNDRLDFQYSTDATSLTTGTWTDVDALDFVAPTGTAGPLDGNLAANRVALPATNVALTLAPGGRLWIRWTDFDAAGSDDGLGVDDFALTATTGTAPVAATYYAKASGNLDDLATFGTNADGTGTAPPGFAAANATYRVGGTGRTIGSDWTVGGTGSKVVLETGAAFVVPAAFNFSGPLDLGANALLVQRNAAPALAFGTLDASSTVDFAQTGAYVVPATPSYGNLRLTNGTKTLAGGTTAVRGNLSVDGVADFNGNGSPFSTLDLKGNFTLANGTAFAVADGSRFTLLLSSGAAQTLTGNGLAFRLFRLSTVGATSAALATAGGSSALVLGNANGGGYTLATGSSLALNGNALTFAVGNTSIGAGAGLLTATAGSLLTFNHLGTTPPGTLRLGAGERPASLTLNASSTTAAGQTLALGGTTTLGGLTLAAGTLSIGAGNGLTVDGPLDATAPAALQGSATSSFAFTGSGAIAGALLVLPATGTALGTLRLARAAFGVLPLAATVTVGTLALERGALFLGGTDRLIALALDPANPGNAQSYVNALTLLTPAVTTATLTYPLGRNGVFRPLTLVITAQTGATTAYTARQNEDNTSGRGVNNTNGGSLTRVSSRRYFALAEEGTANFQSANLTLSFGGADSGVNNLASLRVASSDGPAAPYADVDPNGTPATTGTPAAGTITVPITVGGSPLPEDFALATTATDPTENPLPVTLVRFGAARTAAGVRLAWATASERNSARFEVQRSATGGAAGPGTGRGTGPTTDFVTIATVAAQGNAATPTDYAYVDEKSTNPPIHQATAYYRLRQVDTDGAAHYSAVVAVAPAPPAAALLAYPNPTPDALTLAGPVAAGQPVQVLDLTGRPLRQFALPASGRVSLQGLPAGTYLLRVAERTLRVTKE